MNEWTDVASVTDIRPGTCQAFVAAGVAVVVFNLEGHFFCLEDCCSHDGAELSSGEMDSGEIICPRHGARFDIRTGAVCTPPAYENIQVVPVRSNNGMVQIKQ
ncbi:Rieske 2Fe-2S domain-containing protein [Candidatus Magnetaquicoccus inordinatus]|uniref:Rieske 2Fe-2S domain-containing protein n=1 Tax=Candidatus Magnetaquicoccus inordinatus TaxID=2496818 RepID=UPI00102D0C60|nr:Rieske 2Fe-2S domain-containing protein [Candidatus Magnetaquicoccus inordinatus]